MYSTGVRGTRTGHKLHHKLDTLGWLKNSRGGGRKRSAAVDLSVAAPTRRRADRTVHSHDTKRDAQTNEKLKLDGRTQARKRLVQSTKPTEAKKIHNSKVPQVRVTFCDWVNKGVLYRNSVVFLQTVYVPYLSDRQRYVRTYILG